MEVIWLKKLTKLGPILADKQTNRKQANMLFTTVPHNKLENETFKKIELHLFDKNRHNNLKINILSRWFLVLMFESSI